MSHGECDRVCELPAEFTEWVPLLSSPVCRSEHERHAMQCPFMRGEPTENVPVAGESLQVCGGNHSVVIVVRAFDC